jgi:glycolate oxidase
MNDSKLITRLKKIVGRDYVVHKPDGLIVFEYDGSVDRSMPAAVVLPASTSEVSQVVATARELDVPIVARGAGTGLSGGAVPTQGSLVLSMTRMNRILEVDPENHIAVVEPGVVNLDLSAAVAEHDLYYAPDPSSQQACTIGGNVAENSGGPHCLAYGVTTNHVLGVEVVLADGSVVWLGGRTSETSGLDIRGVVIGSEGTLAVVTKVVVRLLRRPEAVKTLLAVYASLDEASAAVSDVIGSGIIPAAMEMMDDLAIAAAEPAVHAGYPDGAGAVLLVEVDGLTESVEEESELIEAVMARHSPMEVRVARDADERARLWAGRKGALGALGRLAPNYYLIDGTIPRTRLVEVMAKIKDLSAESGFPIANVLHAGDGNLHPSILFDERKPGETERVLELGGRILKLCVDVGGVLSGEHGIGIEKREYMPYMFNERDLSAMKRLKDAFDTRDALNPGKIFPQGVDESQYAQSGSVSKAGPGAHA